MTPTTNESQKPGGAVRHRWIGLALFVFVLLIVGIVSWYVRKEPIPEPPFVPLERVEAPVARAIEQARDRVRRSPRSSAVWGRLGMLLAGHGFRPQAIPCFSTAEQLDSKDPRWPYLLGLTLHLEGLDAEAIPPLRRAAHLCPRHPDRPRLRLAELLVKEGQGEEAEGYFRALLQENSDHGPAHLGMARLALSRGNIAAACEHLRPCLDDPSVRKAGHLLLAEAEQQRGHAQAVGEALRLAAKLPPDQDWPDPFQEEVEVLKMDRRTRWEHAWQQYGRGRNEDFALLLDDLERDFPGTVPLLEGRRHLDDKNFNAAEQVLREAVRLAPDFPQAHYWLGVALMGQRRINESSDCFREILKLQPHHVEACMRLAECLEQQGDRTSAIEFLRDAARYAPQNADAHRRLGALLAREGRDSEAAIHLKQAVSLQTDEAGKRRQPGPFSK